MTTNMLQPVYNNSAVVFSFYGNFYDTLGRLDQNKYAKYLVCSAGMMPSLVSLDASWGFGTSFGFDLNDFQPERWWGDYNSYSIELSPSWMYFLMYRNGGTPVPYDPPITFRAEYVCNCPGAYAVRAGSPSTSLRMFSHIYIYHSLRAPHTHTRAHSRLRASFGSFQRHYKLHSVQAGDDKALERAHVRSLPSGHVRGRQPAL